MQISSRHIFRFSISLFVFIFLCKTAFAQPSITDATGLFINGETVIITGSNFGNHPDNNKEKEYVVAAWENLEAGKANKSILSANTGPELVSDPKSQRNNSNFCARGYRWRSSRTYTNVFGETKTDSKMYGLGYNSSGQNIAFISGWFMFPPGFQKNISYQGEFDQTKFLMLSPLKDQPKTYYSVTAPAIKLRLNTEEGILGKNLEPLSFYSPEGEWHRFDIYVDISKPRGQKIHRWYVDGQLLRNDTYCESSGCQSPLPFTKFTFLGYQFEGSDSHAWMQYVDDMYVDFTQARVEISKSPTWLETKRIHKELQIPTAWSEKSIKIQVNQGSFNIGDMVYLYVVDEEGNVNNQGYPIVFGDGGYIRPSPPSSGGDDEIEPPKGLKISSFYNGGLPQ